MDAATGLSVIQTLQSSLSVLTALQLTSHKYPQSASVDKDLSFDYVVIGGGTAGSILAARLSEDAAKTVALIEAGDDEPLESMYPGIFPLTVKTNYDYNFIAENDKITSQHAQDKTNQMTAGKLLGGTSAIHHMNYYRGNPKDFLRWAQETGDDMWTYENILPYFIKLENMQDEDILNSETASLHGTSGPIELTREPHPMNTNYINALGEMGIEYNLDASSNYTLGVTDSIFMISKDGVRQDTATCYLSPAKDRTNLYVYKQTVATKILFDDNKNAIGVEAVTSDSKTLTFKANKEVILSAGAIKSPQLLMLSGVGPQEQLEKFNIPVVADLPVGETLRDKAGVAIAYKMQEQDMVIPPADPRKFPVPITFTFKAMDESQTLADFLSINLAFPHDQLGLTMVSGLVLKYENDVTDKFIEANTGHELFMAILSNGHPTSTGKLTLKSTDPTETPEIKFGVFSDSADVDDMAEYLNYYTQIQQTSHFQNVGAEFVKIDLPECDEYEFGTLDYWKCYAVSMSVPFWQTISTCSMGSVVDSNLRVKGVNNLRVVDASVLPYFVCGEPAPAVMAVAEKAADLIKQSQ